jgi:hypothetical protein
MAAAGVVEGFDPCSDLLAGLGARVAKNLRWMNSVFNVQLKDSVRMSSPVYSPPRSVCHTHPATVPPPVAAAIRSEAIVSCWSWWSLMA